MELAHQRVNESAPYLRRWIRELYPAIEGVPYLLNDFYQHGAFNSVIEVGL